MSLNSRNGRPRPTPPAKHGALWPHEIEAGRSVPGNWDRELLERWEDRKARRAAERAALAGNGR